jgi:hypothetical protein
MAVNYQTLFGKIGKIIAKLNSYLSFAGTTLPADLDAIITQYGTAATTYGTALTPLDGQGTPLTTVYANFEQQFVTFRQNLKPFIERTLTDVDTVLSQLSGLKSNQINDVLAGLIQDMTDNSQSIRANLLTLGGITVPGSGNTGTGTAFADATLDGLAVPLLGGGFANLLYNGLPSQLGVASETIQLTCTADSFSGGQTEGGEAWAWQGGIKYPAFDFHVQGSGAGPSVTTAHTNTSLQNIQLTSWGGTGNNTPSSWVVGPGAAGTDVFRESTTVYRGKYGLRFVGTGNTQPAITQAITRTVQSRRRYLFTIRVQRDPAQAPGAGNLVIKFTGTGYTAAGSEQINVALNGIPITWTLYSFFINMPANMPSNMTLNISITGANLGSGAKIYLSSGSFAPVNYAAGVNVSIVSGSTPWVAGDRLQFTIANNETSKFASFFRDGYGCQLPSKSDATETISNGLAT